MNANPSDVTDFLAEVYAAEDSGRIDHGINRIFQTLNTWLQEDELARCDEALRLVDVTRLGVDLALSFITITRAARAHLKERVAYYQRARARIVDLEGEAYTHELMGLREN